MDRKRRTPGVKSLTFITDKSQPTISQSFNRVEEDVESMGDSDDEVQILNTARGARIERRTQLAKEKAAKSIVNEEARLQEQEDAELQRAIELSKKEAAASASACEHWETLPAHHLGQQQTLADRHEDRAVREDEDEDILLGDQDDTSDEERKSIKSEILLDSDHEREDRTGVDIDISGATSSRTSEGSVSSVTFPANHLHQPDADPEEEVEEEEEETQLLEDEESGESEEVEEVGQDEAGIYQGRERAGDFNTSEDLFSQGDGNHKLLQEESKETMKIAKGDSSDDDFMLDLEDTQSKNETRKSTRLSLRKRKRLPEDSSMPIKSLKVADSDDDDAFEGDTQIMETNDASGSKEDIERLVHGPFSLTQSEADRKEERLTDSRKYSATGMSLYCPPSSEPADYSVAIRQMFECYLRQLRRFRYLSSGERCWGNPIRPGPHLVKYLIHRRRGVRIPPSDEDSAVEEQDQVGEEGPSQSGEADQRVNKYVLDESDDDFEPVNVTGRRKLPAVNNKRNIKRPRSEPKGNEEFVSYPIVCPKPIRRPPDPVTRHLTDASGGPMQGTRGDITPNKGRPPTPTVRTFNFSGEGSPQLNTKETRNQSFISSPSHSAWSTPQKLRRSSSNPEFGSLSSKLSADSSTASCSTSPVFHNQATQSHPSREEEKSGPSKQVAWVQPRNSSSWLSKASAKASSTSEPQDLEGGFIREPEVQRESSMVNEEMVPRERNQSFPGDPTVERPRSPSPQVPSLLKAKPKIQPGIECPLCGQSYPVSVIEAHASECDGSISLDDEVDNIDAVTEEPASASLTNYGNPPTATSRETDRLENDQRLDHIDAAILQMVENNEITLVPSKTLRKNPSRSLRDDVEADESKSRFPRSRKSNATVEEEESWEKCFMCQKMIPKEGYLSHVEQHKELRQAKKGRLDTSDESLEESQELPADKKRPAKKETRPPAGDQMVNGMGDTPLREIYGPSANLEEREEECSDDDDSLEWTCPGIPSGVSDSPIKSYRSIKDSMSIVDFKNQFKEADSVKSRVKSSKGGRGRGRGRGRNRRGRGRGGRRGKR